MLRNLIYSFQKEIKSNHFLKNIFNKLIKYTFLKRFLFFYIFKPNKFRRKYNQFKLDIVFKKQIKDSEHLKVIINKKKSFKTIEIHFSKKILDNALAILREYHCFKIWIPSIIKSAKIADQAISLDFHIGDVGEEEYLSMEQANSKNLIPDIYSFKASSEIIQKKIIKQKFIDFKNIWLNKENKIFWRGTTTGRDYKSINELESIERIKICKIYKNNKNIDIKITKIRHNLISNIKVKKYLIVEDLFAEEVSEDKFASYRYYPDIPGNSLGWGTVKKFLYGNLIFKPNHKKQLLYYQFLHPWIHFVPVKDDFSDLEEKFNWSQENIDQTIEIAYRGYITIFDYLQNIDKYFINSILKYRQ